MESIIVNLTILKCGRLLLVKTYITETLKKLSSSIFHYVILWNAFRIHETFISKEYK